MQHMLVVLGLSLCLVLAVLCRPLALTSNRGFPLGDAGLVTMGGTRAGVRDAMLAADGSRFDAMSDLEEDGNHPEEDRYSPPSHRHHRVTSTDAVSQTPEYMLELYNNLSKNRPNLHSSNIVRSFKNIPQKDRHHSSIMNEFGYRIHVLLFNTSALDVDENINSAELRLFTLIKKDQRTFSGVSRIVSIFQVEESGGRKSRDYITSKFVHSAENAWESFDVTKALQRRSTKPAQRRKNTEVLEVKIQSLLTHPSFDNMDITIDPNDTRQPLLVVYSNDNSPVHEHEAERHDLLVHDMATNVAASHKMVTYNDDDESDSHTSHRRSKRSRNYARNSACRLRPLYVNFADIGYDSWIIAPRGYNANQCAGRCYFPFTDSMSPSSHAIIQYSMKQRFPRRVSRVCCVPTKLEPISLLYYDRGVYTYKYRYDGMVVTECGCR